MARVPSDLIGPASSIGSPMTFMMRPSVPSPTGTAIGCPVSVTCWPRTRPSVASIAIVRTVDSPRCCATSRTRRLLPFLVSSELRMAGRWPSNCTSTTAPMTWVTRPIWLAAVAINLSFDPNLISCFGSPSDRLGAGDDLDQLLGDHGLTGAVVNQCLLADHFARVAGGVVHRAHLRAVERGVVLKQRAEDLGGEIARKQRLENLVLFGLVFVGRRRRLAVLLLHFQRNELLGRWNLGDDRPEAGEEQRADVELACLETGNDLVCDVLGIVEAKLPHAAQIDVLDNLLLELPAQLIVAFAPDAEELDFLAFGHQLCGALARQTHDRGVEGPAKTALAGADQQQVHLVPASAGQQRGGAGRTCCRACDVGDHRFHLFGKRPARFGGGLRAAQLGGGYHLH